MKIDFAILNHILQAHGTGADKVIPILQAVQNEFHYLPQEALEYIAENSDITLAQIQGVASFYSQFRFTPAGKHTIKVCVGTACHVKGAQNVYDALKRELHIPDNTDTDSQGEFTIEKVACLGCCTLAPVVQIDEKTYGHVETGQVPEILTDFKASESVLSSKIIKVFKEKHNEVEGEIRIGLGSCCIASGSADVKSELDEVIRKHRLNVRVKQVGCVGVCNQVPMMEIYKPNEKPEIYTKIQAGEVSQIMLKHFKPAGFAQRMNAKLSVLLEELVYAGKPKVSHNYSFDDFESPVTEFLDGQLPLATEYRGFLKPSDLSEYMNVGGFSALKTALTEKSKQEIIDTIKESGLRGRGGGGFLTGMKWQIAANELSEIKYMICNGDEGDPGAFMDRMLLESYPFRIIEGMLIAAFAVGATNGLFYIRAEYPLAVERIKQALKTCREQNIIGSNILGTNFSFEIEVFEGAGAFVCGEETALIASVEGKRGYPTVRPPFPAVKGLNGKPTLINNVETLSLVPWIIRNGADRFNTIGTSGGTGTKVFALAGKINRGGLIEVPMGITISDIVFKIGGGIPNNKQFKAVQIGGPSGGCIPENLCHTKVDFESLKAVGAMMGSGGLIVLDEEDCMVDIARYFLSFTQDQSCGRCTFCRIGTRRMLDILNLIVAGKGTEKDLHELEKLAHSVKAGSICGLGKTAPNPVLSTMHYFRHEYEAHLQGKCLAGKCTQLIQYEINNSCIGCTKCAQVCPTAAILPKPYELHEVNNELCVKCDVCRQICPVEAIDIVSGKVKKEHMNTKVNSLENLNNREDNRNL